jgi:Ca-activated chloride channel family protein
MTTPRMTLIVGAATLGASILSAATQDPQQPTFRTGVRTVTVPTTVTDGFGHFALDLKKEDFEIRDNGRVQEITIFDRQVQSITAVLLLDASASMLSALKSGIAAVDDFIVRLMPGDQAKLGSFSEDIRITPTFSGDRDQLLDVFANEFDIKIGRRTRLWDAIDDAVTALTGASGKRVVVVFSDGRDTWSLKRFDDVLGHARREDVMIYCVELHDADGTGQRMEMRPGPDGSSPGKVSLMQPANAFEVMAEDTGGGFISVAEPFGRYAPFTQVALELHSQYMLAFSTSTLDGKVHKLDVRVKQADLKVRARKTYLAAPEGSDKEHHQDDRQ